MSEIVSASMTGDGQPNQIANAFRLAMRQMGQTVTVIACRDPETGNRYGMTASSVTSLSMEPPAIVACINNDASMRPVLSVGQQISINILSDEQSALSNAFATEPDTASRFDHGDWRDEPVAADETTDGTINSGKPLPATPYLNDCASHMLATIRELKSWGTHVLVIAEINSAMTDPTRKPLLYHDGTYIALGNPIADQT